MWILLQAYAKFSGAKVTVSPIDWTWKTLTGGLLFPVTYGSDRLLLMLHVQFRASFMLLKIEL